MCCSKLWVLLFTTSKCNNASEGQDEVDHQHYKVVYTQRKERIKVFTCLTQVTVFSVTLTSQQSQDEPYFPTFSWWNLLRYVDVHTRLAGTPSGKRREILGTSCEYKKNISYNEYKNISYTSASDCLSLLLFTFSSEPLKVLLSVLQLSFSFGQLL